MLDHVVLATPDLAATVADLTTRFGIAPSPGGPHLGLGTRNVLYSLGADVYLEVVGPDPDQPDPDGPRPLRVDEVDAATVVWWCARSDDLAAVLDRASAVGLAMRGPVAMRRQSPHGLLAWRCLFPEFDTFDGLVPFFIDWGSTRHPATTSVGGVALVRVALIHPTPTVVQARLRSLGVEIEVRAGETPRIAVLVSTRHGEVEL